MIMDAEGHILTNHHVASGASKIEVLLTNGQQDPARVVGTDPKTDLAVIKIEAKGALPYVTFGDSDAVEVGEWVVAIGHPRGLDQTVTHGIISAKHRRGITDPSSYQDFLQTDAAITADFRGRKLTHTGFESRVLESDREIVQPWNRRAFLIQGGFAQERMVRPLVEAYDEAVSVHCEQATGFHKLAIELFGLRFVEPMQLSGHPPRAAVGQDRQGDIHVHL